MKIEEYRFGRMTVDGRTFTRDLIICGDKIIENWWRKSGHKLAVEDIEEVIRRETPEILVVGAGRFGMMKVLPETEKFLQEQGVQLKVANTSEAMEIFNELTGGKKVVGAFHLTC